MTCTRTRRPKTKKEKEKENARKKERYHSELKFDSKYKAKVSKATRNWQLRNQEKYMWGRSKQSAKASDIPFDLEVSDIVIPEECPIMKVPMIVGTRYAPSVDRIIPDLGYTKGNVWVISKIANQMKSNSTKEERMKFCKYFLGSNI